MRKNYFKNILYNLSLTGQLIIMGFFGVVIASLLLVIVVVVRINHSQTNMTIDSLEKLGNNSEQRMDSYVQTQLDFLTYIADLDEFKTADYEGQEALIKDKNIEPFSYIFVQDIEGNDHYFMKHSTMDYGEESLHSIILQRDEYVTAPFYNEDTGKANIILCKSIYDYDNRKIGAVCGALDLTGIQDVIFKDEVIFDGSCLIIAAHAKYIASGTEKEIPAINQFFSGNSREADIIKNIFDDHVDRKGVSKVNGHKYLYCCKYIDVTGWVILYYVNGNVFNSTVRNILVHVYLVGFLFLLLIFVAYRGYKVYIQARERSFRDSLTGCYNRMAFDKVVNVLKYKRESLAVVYMDLNKFKHINDCFGHETGDKALCVFGEQLNSLFDTNALVVRLGGDEFAVLALGADAAYINSKFNLLQKHLWEKGKEINEQLELSASYGYSFFTKSPGKTILEVVSEADDMMYAYKKEHNFERE